jgi:hypothetical protein
MNEQSETSLKGQDYYKMGLKTCGGRNLTRTLPNVLNYVLNMSPLRRLVLYPQSAGAFLARESVRGPSASP